MNYIHNMAEKKGFTGKLRYDFEVSKCLEVYLESSQKWHRVIAKEFRSWYGQRRIVIWDKEGEQINTEYHGPVYYYLSNDVVKVPSNVGIQYRGERIMAKQRQWESF